MLQERDPHSGLRDIMEVTALGTHQGMRLNAPITICPPITAYWSSCQD